MGVGRVTLAGDTVAAQPAGVVEVIVSAIIPVNPLTAFAEMVEVPVLGAVYVMVVGLALRAKSVTWNSIAEVVWVKAGVVLVPVTVTV